MALVNFNNPPTASPYTRYQYIWKQPIAPIKEKSPIEFFIENNGYAFIDLKQTRFHVKLKLVRANGTPVHAADKVGLVNLPLQSIWRHIEVYLQNRMVCKHYMKAQELL